jgi:hypothetical protein
MLIVDLVLVEARKHLCSAVFIMVVYVLGKHPELTYLDLFEEPVV